MVKLLLMLTFSRMISELDVFAFDDFNVFCANVNGDVTVVDDFNGFCANFNGDVTVVDHCADVNGDVTDVTLLLFFPFTNDVIFLSLFLFC